MLICLYYTLTEAVSGDCYLCRPWCKRRGLPLDDIFGSRLIIALPLSFDLKKPQERGIDLIDICMTAGSKLSTSFYFNFGAESFAKVPIHEEKSDVQLRLAMEAVEGIRIQWDSKGAATSLFLSTHRGIYCFELDNGKWFLTAEYRVYGQMRFKEALKLVHSCDHRQEPSQAVKNQANFKISTARAGHNPILGFIRKSSSTQGFENSSPEPFSQANNVKLLSSGSVEIELRNRGHCDVCRYGQG